MTALKILRISALSITAVFVTATAGSAQDTATDTKAAAPALQTVAVQAGVQVASLSMPIQPAGGGLRADPRWPAMVNCINNTATPVEFETCLRSAFMVDGTGMAATLARN